MEGTIYPLLDRLLDGQLADLLRSWRTDERLSYEAIARRFLIDHDVSVSTDTVRRWLDELGIRKGEKAA